MSPYASGVYKWIGLGVALVLGILTAVLGIVEEIAGLYVVFYTAATFALVVWVWNYAASRWMTAPAGGGPDAASAGGTITRAGVRAFIAKNRIVLLALLALIAVFAIIAATVEGFFTIINIISMLVLLALLVAVIVFNRFAAANIAFFQDRAELQKSCLSGKRDRLCAGACHDIVGKRDIIRPADDQGTGMQLLGNEVHKLGETARGPAVHRMGGAGVQRDDGLAVKALRREEVPCIGAGFIIEKELKVKVCRGEAEGHQRLEVVHYRMDGLVLCLMIYKHPAGKGR